MQPGYEYVQFFHELYEKYPASIIPIFCLSLFRLAPIVVLAPFLGAKLPSLLKVGLLVALVGVFFPFITMECRTEVQFNLLFIAYAAKEVFLGFVIAFLVSFPFHVVDAAGVLIDFQRGASSLQVSNPFSQAQTSPIGNLYTYMLTVLFYLIGGFFFFLDAIFSFYRLVPIDAFLHPVFFSSPNPFWQVIMGLATKLTALSIQLCAPSLLAILMTEVFLGIANRLAPQVQIAFLGMSVKSLLGLAMLCYGWLFILRQVENQTFLWLQDLDKWLYYFPTKIPP